MVKKVVVFFGCFMRGGHGIVSQADLAKFPDIIEELGYALASKHQTKNGVIAKENLLAPTHIHDRDYRWLLESHVGVFEISNPSLGVGGEIADMLHERKPVLCLFKGNENSISAYIRGKWGSGLIKAPFEYHAYATMEDARDIIAQFIIKNI